MQLSMCKIFNLRQTNIPLRAAESKQLLRGKGITLLLEGNISYYYLEMKVRSYMVICPSNERRAKIY